MTEISIFLAVGMLVGFVLLKGYTTKALSQLRLECSRLMAEERRLRHERDQEEILVESAEAKRNQAQYDVKKYAEELEDLTGQVQRIEEELGRSESEEQGAGGVA